MFSGKRRWIGAALLLAVLLFVAFVRLSPWMAQDACLDGGGAWRDGRCVH